MDESQFQILDVKHAGENLSRLHEMVVAEKKRIELVAGKNAGMSVIISKEELDSLERALAILSNTPDVRKLAEMLQKIARMTTPGLALDEPIPAAVFPV